MGKIRFISDTHFNHKNVIELTSRSKYFQPKDVDSMEKEIIKRWNSVVAKDDIVYLLGDFAFGSKDLVSRLVSQLNGKIRLLLGNHDKRKKPHWYDGLGFDAVYAFPIVIEDWFILSHEPIKYLTQKMPYINIHGHTHDEEYTNLQRVNVCWEVLDGYPVDFETIKAKFIELDNYNNAIKISDQDKHNLAVMNYNDGYLQGFIDGKKGV